MRVSIESRNSLMKRLLCEDMHGNYIISFYDPNENSIKGEINDIEKRVCDIIYIPVYDIDKDELSEFELSYDEFFPEAGEAARFIYEVYDAGDNAELVCQCEYGQSRSAACAAAVLQHFMGNGIEIFTDYRYFPNKMIYNKLYTALKQYKEIKNEGL